MEFEWDDKKAETNLKNHKVDFEKAIYVFEGPTVERVDPRDYGGETRFVTFGIVDGRLLAVVYTWRGNNCRIISARKANEREQRAYHSALLSHGSETNNCD